MLRAPVCLPKKQRRPEATRHGLRVICMARLTTAAGVAAHCVACSATQGALTAASLAARACAVYSARLCSTAELAGHAGLSTKLGQRKGTLRIAARGGKTCGAGKVLAASVNLEKSGGSRAVEECAPAASQLPLVCCASS